MGKMEQMFQANRRASVEILGRGREQHIVCLFNHLCNLPSTQGMLKCPNSVSILISKVTLVTFLHLFLSWVFFDCWSDFSHLYSKGIGTDSQDCCKGFFVGFFFSILFVLFYLFKCTTLHLGS